MSLYATTFLSLLALSISFQLSESALRGGRSPNAQKINCSHELEMRIACVENCGPSNESPSLEQRFQIEVITKTDKIWELREATVAAGSFAHPFEFLPLSTDPMGREIAPTRPIALPWSIESDDVVGEQVILLATAAATNESGDMCRIQATYQSSSEQIPAVEPPKAEEEEPKTFAETDGTKTTAPETELPDDENNSDCLKSGVICWNSPTAARKPCNTCCNGYQSVLEPSWAGSCL